MDMYNAARKMSAVTINLRRSNLSAITPAIGPRKTAGNKRAVKTPKVYFRDSGLLCHLLGLDENSLPRSSLLGAVWEGFVFAELRKLAAARERRGKFWFYRDQSGREVDFIYEKGGTLDFMEAKWTEHPDRDDAKTVARLLRDLAGTDSPERPGQGIIISRAPIPYALDNALRVVPASALTGLL